MINESNRKDFIFGAGSGMRDQRVGGRHRRPKASLILAQGDALGGMAPREFRRLKACLIGEPSVPNISLVVFNVVFAEKSQELLLKGDCLVMLLLIFDVLQQPIQLGWSEEKATIASLPIKLRILRSLSLHPDG
jgi:hypothetical protein